jgi:uncharacterized protein
MTGKAELPRDRTSSDSTSSLPKPDASEKTGRRVRIPSILLEGDEPVPAPATVPAPEPAKVQELSPRTCVEPSKSEAGALPEAYGTGRLLLVARDPHCLYVHWDLTDEQQCYYSALAADGYLHVRVCRNAVAGWIVAEVRAHPQSRHLFVQVKDAGVGYVAELGYHQHGHQWVSLAVSNSATTPSQSISTDKTVQLTAIAPIHSLSRSTEPEGRTTSETAGEIRDKVVLETLKTISLPVIAWLPGLEPGQAPQVPLIELVRRTLPESQTSGSSPEWTAVQEFAFTEVLRLVEMPLGTTGSLASEQLVQREIQHKVRPAPAFESESLPQQSPAISQWPSSPEGGELPARKGFWLNINAELIVYGATEPNARVTIGGLPIELRPDGTFSCRFSLPDGNFELPVVAVSSEQDSRTAKLAFTRCTEHQGAVGAAPQSVTPIP